MRGQNKFFKIILFLGDILVLGISLYLALFIRGRLMLLDSDTFLYNFLFIYVIWLLIIFILNLYDVNFFKKPLDFLFNVIIFSFLAVFLGVAFFYFRPKFGITPKTTLMLNVAVFDVVFLCWRYLFNLIAETGGVKEKMVVIGFRPELNNVLDQINRSYEIVAFFCPPYLQSKNNCQSISFGVEVVSDVKELNKIIQNKKVTSVLLVTANQNLIAEIFYKLPLKINYIDFNDLYEVAAKKVSIEYLDEAWFLEKISKPEDKFEQLAKRLFDIFFSVVGLVLFLIFLPFIAIAIKLDSKGNIFYTQKRVGKNGKTFLIHKFRTMTEDKNQYKETWRETNKNNITRVGKVLRRLHLDELPQAWNILKGDLSFVGPRAEWQELAEVFEKEIPFYKQRYLVKPGLIGWAQINFPPSKSINEAKEKFEYDLYYIKNHSLLLDIEIILKAAKLFLW